MLDELFLQVLNMSFTGAIVIIFVLLARLLLKKTPKVFSYALWSVVLFRLVCPFSFEAVFSLLPTRANPIAQDIAYMALPRIDTGLSVINNTVNAVLPPATPLASINPLQIYIFIGSVIWLFGIAALLVYSLVTLLRLKGRLKNAALYKDNIFLTDTIDTAFVLGVFRPQIYLPANLNDGERDYILLHEQTHIRRLDHIAKLAGFLVLCVHWFNPLVWVSFSISGRDMEMACDEAVIKQLGNGVKKDYSSSLLALATGRRIVGGTPLAFGEGDTKGRIKNVLRYKRPAFWVTLAAVVAVICAVAGLMTNPKDKETGLTRVNAVILEIDKENQTMMVQGIDENSVIGDLCIITWEGNPFVTVATSSKPTRLSLDDFAIGDHVVVLIGEVQESYPTRAKASTIQLQPKEIPVEAYSAENLWNARTRYVGGNSAVGKLIGLLPVPEGLRYDHFALHTSEQPYNIEIVYSVTADALRSYDTENPPVADTFSKHALLLLALVDNAQGIRSVLTDGTREVGFINGREWADYTVGSDVRDYAASPELLQELIDLPLPSLTPTGNISFWVKPDEPAEVIGSVAANVWLGSFVGENVPEESRIKSFKVRNMTVITGTPKAGIAPEDMKYQYVVQLHYDITTATERYFAPGDGISGEGTFENLFRELCVRYNPQNGGMFEIVAVGTGGGTQEFAQES